MSKVTKLECPNCGAGLPAPEEGNSLICCPYCATPLNYDKHDASYRIDKKVEKVTHKIDHAKLAEIEYKERKEKADNRFLAWFFIICGIAFGIMCLYEYGPHLIRDVSDKSKATSLSEQGYVNPGESAEDFEGEKVNAGSPASARAGGG